MSGTIYNGICSTCKHVSTCALRRDSRKPLFYCEEFEIEVTPPGRAVIGDKEPHVAEAEDSTTSIGLCIDCENARTCTFRKPEGGVWHCEEYR